MSIIGALLLMVSVGISGAYYQNQWDGPLHVTCPAGQAFTRVQSVHSNHYEDRRWYWGCGTSRCSNIQGNQGCNAFSKANVYDKVVNFCCANGYALTGVSSYHHDHYEDREWTFQCCKPYGKRCSHRNVYTTGFVNDMDTPIYFYTTQVIIGTYSYHNDHTEDRRWKFTTADIVCDRPGGRASTDGCCGDPDGERGPSGPTGEPGPPGSSGPRGPAGPH